MKAGLSLILLFALTGCSAKKQNIATVMLDPDDQESYSFTAAASIDKECTGIHISWLTKEMKSVPVKDLPASQLLITQPAPFSEPDKWDAYLYVKDEQHPRSIYLREHGINTLARKICFAIKGGGATVDLRQ